MADCSDKVVGEEFDVFISYAHADREEDSDRSPAQTLAGMLEAEGYRVWWDRELIGGEDWLRELPTNIGLSRKVVALVSPRWLASMDCYAELVRAYETPGKLVPVLIADCALPPAIAHLNAVKATGNLSLAETLILAAIELEPKQCAGAPSTPTDPNRVQLALPFGADRLFGRDRELTTLANAWAATGPGKKTVVVFHAIGGAGKSTLVRAFIDELAQKGYPGAQKVYGWSAYNQNSGENDDTANAEGFIADALKFFGHDLADEPITDGAERGRTLAGLVRAQRSLFILDGLEPLQDAPLINGGRLKDRGLATFITMLADENPGLLVITSRQELPELANKPLVVNHALDQLDTRVGAELLKHLGVHGRERELMDAVTEAGGHALSVNLLGTYLANVCAGDVTRRDTLKLGDIIEDMTEQDETARKAKRAQRVMDAYEKRFHELAAGTSKGNGVAELMIMRLVGLFNRPAEPAAITAVLAAPPIPGLTDAWHSLTPLKRQSQWGFAMARLRKFKLLLGSNVVADTPLDAHPVVRQHFGAELARAAPNAFREANDRLYRYYVALPEREQPETLAEMEPLFHAITHGCAAGRHPEVWSDVYQKRLNREGGTFFIIKQLGAISASLGALANFFTPPWRTPHLSLRLVHQASAFGHAAAALHALGRLRDAIEPMEAGARLRIARKDWEGAAREYSNLSELWLTLGEIAAAIAAGREAVMHADASTDEYRRMSGRTSLAAALHQAGDVVAAEQLFREAEAIQAKRQPDLDKLYSVQGYKYCDHLLGSGAGAEVKRRAVYALEVANQRGLSWLIHSLDTLSLGRAAHVLGDRTNARHHFDDAIEGLRKAGTEHHLPRGLLARAAFRRDTSDLGGAHQDLTEAHEIALRGGMRLHLTDICLEWGCLQLAHLPTNSTAEAEHILHAADRCCTAAADLIKDTGYHRRVGELAALRDAIDRARVSDGVLPAGIDVG